MKRKESFVTNSSSCAFILVVKKISIEEAKNEDIKNIVCLDNSEEGYYHINEKDLELNKDNLHREYFCTDIHEDYDGIGTYPLPKEDGLKLIYGVRAC